MSPDPIRIAIAGTGNIAGIHATTLAGFGPRSAGSAGAESAGNPASGGNPESAASAVIVAACDVDGQRLATFCDEHQIPAAYHDIGTLLRQSRPDLVHVCTPPWLHHEHALACLRAGASVLVEKPPTISLKEFDELTAAESGVAESGTAESGGTHFATVFQHRFGTGQRRLKALAAEQDGPLGRPLLAICHTTWFRDQAYFDVEWRGRWDTEGGGPTMGHGIHQMDMLLDVLGDWTEVSATARRQARRTRTEDVSLAHVTFANGAVASIVNSVLSPREESYLRFDFENATVEVTHLYGYGDHDWRVTPVPGHEHEVLTTWKHAGSGVPSGHAAQFREVLSSLRDGRRPPVAPADSRRTLALATAIYASAFTRRPVTPAGIGPGTQFYGQMNGGSFGW
ncbi:MAG: Gfo/Idh/MocA family oxidoreductase [Streptosporangiaceae bacterium]|nr:Gfo/Idh/MocA family oxidoreductase [Streptosporangiaceae bacterium]